MFRKFFQRSKERLHNPHTRGNELATKINIELQNAEKEKNNTIKEIEQIKNWAAEAIIETYADIFPEGNLTYYKEKYKNEALEKYEQIKTENADKTNPEKAVKCDKIVKAYFSQIKLRESKIILYDKIIDKYNTLKNKINETEEIKQAKNKIHKHEERIKKLDGEKADTEYENALTDTLKLEELEREFQLKTEYTKQLSALQKKYKDEKNVEDYTTSLAFKEEIDKMIDELEQQT